MNILVGIGGFISNISASKVATDIVKSLTPENTSKIGKVLSFIGTMVIGGMVGSAAEDYAKKEITKVTEAVKLLSKNSDDDEDTEED